MTKLTINEKSKGSKKVGLNTLKVGEWFMREVLIEFEVMARKNAFGLPDDEDEKEKLKNMVELVVDNFLKEREG